MLNHQNNILLYKSLPKQYKPKVPTVSTKYLHENINECFWKSYEELFLKHLSKVVSHNTASLDIVKKKQDDLRFSTEMQLNTLTLPNSKITKLKETFKNQCEAEPPQPPQPPQPFQIKKKNPKLGKPSRPKCLTDTSPPTKKHLPTPQQPFLGLGHLPQTAPT